MTSKNKLTYKAAYEELEAIVTEIESGELDLDDLLQKVERAAILIQYCKEKLKNSEANIQKILTHFDKEKE